ncbi:unnamed protein product [Closterium sp. NIES-64]|nr:unnamed protein product [Closterium sp. NIES-64]
MLPCAALSPLAAAPAAAFPAIIRAGALRADSRHGGSANDVGCGGSSAFLLNHSPLARGLHGWDHRRKQSLGRRSEWVLVRAQGSSGNEGEISDEESFADVEKVRIRSGDVETGGTGGTERNATDGLFHQLMDYFTFKAVKTVLQQLLEMNPSQYSFLYDFTVNNRIVDGSTYIRTLVQERQELGERIMITRLDLFTRWKKRYSHSSMHDAIKEQNLALLREHLLQTVRFRASAARSRISSPRFHHSSPLVALSPLKSASSARFSPLNARLLRTPPHGATAASRGGSARARGKGDGDADPRERAEPVEAEIVGEDEWDQWRGRGRAGGSGMRGAQGGFSAEEREMLRRLGAEELPPGWDSADVYLLEENVPTVDDSADGSHGSEKYHIRNARRPDSHLSSPAKTPSRCQPWTIVLTGAVVVGMSWVVLHFIFVTLLVAAAIGVWWLTFLVAYPAAYKEMVQEERRRRGM